VLLNLEDNSNSRTIINNSNITNNIQSNLTNIPNSSFNNMINNLGLFYPINHNNLESILKLINQSISLQTQISNNTNEKKK
jgi:hypothetical protein